MKKFIIRFSIILCLLAVTDICFGIVMDYMRTHARGGETSRTEYICNHTTEDILIMGSSRAAHHYVPSLFRDSLGMSAYNCGYDGCGVILAYAQLQSILKRYTPKCIVYELTPSFDFVEGDNLRYIKTMRPYFHSGVLDELISDIDNTESIKNYSSFYRYNSSFMTNLSDFLRPSDASDCGYKPEYKIARNEPKKNKDYTDARPQDNYKTQVLKRFIKCCKDNNIQLVIAVSPLYTNDSISIVFQPIFDVLSTYNIPIFNHSCDSNFNWKRKYFSDSCHLNDDGAKDYSKRIISELKTILK